MVLYGTAFLSTNLEESKYEMMDIDEIEKTIGSAAEKGDNRDIISMIIPINHATTTIRSTKEIILKSIKSTKKQKESHHVATQTGICTHGMNLRNILEVPTVACFHSKNFMIFLMETANIFKYLIGRPIENRRPMFLSPFSWLVG